MHALTCTMTLLHICSLHEASATVKFHYIGFGNSGEGLDCSMHVFCGVSCVHFFGDFSGFVFYCIFASSEHNRFAVFCQGHKVLWAWVCQCFMFYGFDFGC